MWGFTFRTDGPWGAGKNSKLTNAERDNDDWILIQQILAKQAQGVGIATIEQPAPNQLSFQMTDHSYQGPFILPVGAALPVQGLGSVSGAQTLDASISDYFTMTLSGNTSLTVTNWPSPALGRIVADVTNGGSFTLTFPAGSIFSGGAAPTLTHSGHDRFLLSSPDGGSTIFCDVVGQGYA